MKNYISYGLNIYKKLHIEKKAVIWYAVCNILQKGIGFLTIPIFTRILTTEEYGRYSVFISWRDILIIFATLNLYCGVFTKMLVDNKEDQDVCTSSLQGLGCIVSLCFAGIYFLFHNYVNVFLGMNTFTVTILLVYFFFYPAFSLWCTKQRVNNKYISMVLVTVLVSVVTPLLCIMLILLTELREHAVIFGNLAGYIIVGIGFFGLNIKRSQVLYSKKYWIFALKYNIPLIPHYLAVMILGQSDRLMIQKYCGESKAGIYSLAYQVSMMMNIIFNAINSSFVPQSYILMRENRIDKLKQVSMQLVYLGSAFTILAILVAPEFILIMGGENYREAIYILPPVCMSVFITFFYNFFSSVEFYFSKTKKVMLASSVSAAINIFLNWLFIPRFGYQIAAYTTLVSYLILLALHFIFAKKISKYYLGRQIYDGKPTCIMVVLNVMTAMVLLVVYDYVLIRYTIITVLIMICLIKRKVILQWYQGVYK